MVDVRRPELRQSDAIAGLRETLADHEPISARFSRRARRRRQRRGTVGLKLGLRPAFARVPSWLWSPILLVGLMSSGGMGMLALQWLLQPPPLPNCRALSPLAAPAKRMHCAQQLASSGHSDHLAASIMALQNWEAGHPLHQEAQSLLQDWSTALLAEAETLLHSAGLGPAVALASVIPTSSPSYEEAQTAIDSWRQQWQDGEALYQAALVALGEEDWKQVSQQIGQLGQLASPYWHQKRADALSHRLADEQQGRKILAEADTKAASGSASSLAKALTHLETIPPQTVAQQAAAVRQETWSAAVVEAALKALDAGQRQQAVTLAQALPLAQLAALTAADTDSTSPAAIDLIRYSQAQRLATQAQASEQWWLLGEAIAAADRITTEPFAQDIQPQLQAWQTQRDATAQLRVAQAFAGTGQRWFLELSLAQAEAVTPSSPQRSRAESLTQSWQQALAQIAGRPRLMLAQRTAEPGTTEALRAAIDIAQPLVSEGRDWPLVQQALADWRSQLQALEDRPILVKAQEYAATGRFWKAISEAEAIAAGRSLHPQAQDLIAEWQGSLRAAEDRQRLVDAKALAADLRLSRAIDTAGAIAAGSEVYGEAQRAIAQWQQERAAWAARREAEARERAAQAARAPVAAPPPPPVAESNSPPTASSNDPEDRSPYYGYYGTSD